jgi:hypothetical protein
MYVMPKNRQSTDVNENISAAMPGGSMGPRYTFTLLFILFIGKSSKSTVARKK